MVYHIRVLRRHGRLRIRARRSINRNGPTFIQDRSRLTLTARGVDLLASCGFLPSLNSVDIRDKSKEDGLGKAIACLQAAFIVVQIISRLVLKLPLTLLEVNTLAHFFCAFIVYILWWNKPRWILEPTKLEGDWTRPLSAFKYMTSMMSSHADHKTGILRDFGSKPEICSLAYYPITEEPRNNPETQGSEMHDSHESSPSHNSTASSGKFIIKPKIEDPDASPDLEFDGARSPKNHDAAHKVRWQLAAEAVKRFPAVSNLLTNLSLKKPKYTKTLYESILRYLRVSRRFGESLCQSRKDGFNVLLSSSSPTQRATGPPMICTETWAAS